MTTRSTIHHLLVYRLTATGASVERTSIINMLQTSPDRLSFLLPEVKWESPSIDSSGSMPLGNGDICLNVWVESNGDLLFYISKADAWSEIGRLLKIGRVRVAARLTGSPFSQQLQLAEGCIDISAGTRRARIWVDANNPIIHLEITDESLFDITATTEIWRQAERELHGRERDSAYLLQAPFPVIEGGDTRCNAENGRIVWFHRNEFSIWSRNLEQQGLGEWAREQAHTDPLLHRTFGAALHGDGLMPSSHGTLVSKDERSRWHIRLDVLTSQTATPEQWLQKLDEQIKNPRDVEADHLAHCEWWREFWNRSWMAVSGDAGAESVTTGATLQRYLTACCGRGAFPIKFNGALFTADWALEGEEASYDADYRRWGGHYWFQNTRLLYWPLLASGDFEMLAPLFAMYRDALPLAVERTRLSFQHGGAFFCETSSFWGLHSEFNYGYERDGVAPGIAQNAWIRYYWSGSLELLAIGLDYYSHTADQTFFSETFLPLAEEILRFYAEHYPRAEGKIRFEPAMALETWHDVVDPLPEIAGLMWVLDGLLVLPAHLCNNASRVSWQHLRDELPELPLGEVGGETVLLPARVMPEKMSNTENPELYAIFPYPLFGVGKRNLEMACHSYSERRIKGNIGWQQDEIQAAQLGLNEEAQSRLINRFSQPYPHARFLAFWGPHFDWIPDMDHGSVGVLALQKMLLQSDGKAIRLFPAWPVEWDVHFKLHAPHGTTIEAIYRAGNLEHIKVNPPERAADLTIMLSTNALPV